MINKNLLKLFDMKIVDLLQRVYDWQLDIFGIYVGTISFICVSMSVGCVFVISVVAQKYIISFLMGLIFSFQMRKIRSLYEAQKRGWFALFNRWAEEERCNSFSRVLFFLFSLFWSIFSFIEFESLVGFMLTCFLTMDLYVRTCKVRQPNPKQSYAKQNLAPA